MSKTTKRRADKTISVDEKFAMARERKQLLQRSLRQEREISALLRRLASMIEKNDRALDEFGEYMNIRTMARANALEALERRRVEEAAAV
jgi:hypothetical protein